ncbi:unnamed protein product [Oncorhynchus mykiss]|uniref:Olfactomedin-like domain-containing protein n=1 Tax=Oncorhynchus mykiss TaxID=8022 RepID=A0A060YMG0_ONCMY|nr:unnamed protein product [Oncorhynchus mykiss]
MKLGFILGSGLYEFLFHSMSQVRVCKSPAHMTNDNRVPSQGRKVSQGRKETEENLDPQEKIHNRPTMSSWRAPQVRLVLLVLQAPLALLDRLAHKDPRGPPETGVTGPIFPSTLPRPWVDPSHAVPNDGTLSAKEAGKLQEIPLNKKNECIIKSLINPRNISKMESTFGTWMKDTAVLNDKRIWVAEHFSGRTVKEYKSIASFQNATSEVIDGRKFYQGCGHAVHNGSFYYHIAGTTNLARFDLQSKRLHTLAIDNALYHNLSYLLYNSKTYFKLAADENGLWLIFASSLDDSIMVAQLDLKSFSVTSYINTTYPRTKAGNAFVACGVLYVTDTKDTRVTFAFDLLKGKPVNVTFELRSPGGVLAMLSYSPNNRHLYVWDQSYVKLYVVHFISDD